MINLAIVDITIKDRIASVPAGIELVCNNPTDTIRFNFDDEWNGHDVKTARFTWEGNKIEIPFTGNEVKVPEIYRTNYVYVGVFTDGLTSTPAKVSCRYSIKCIGGNTLPPAPDVYAEIMRLFNEGSVEDAKIKGLIDRLTVPFTENGSIVTCYPVEGYPLDVKTRLEPVQEGSGDPSPDNIRPITGYTGAELTRCGKNLACSGVSNITGNGITIKRDGGSELVVYGIAAATSGREGFETILPSGTYTYSLGDIGNITRFEIAVNGTPRTQLFGNDSATFTLDAPAEVRLNMILYEGVDCGTENNPTIVRGQLELGSVSTACEPYRGDTFTLDFGQTVYGGTLDWNTGELTADMGYKVFNGSESWVAFTYADGQKSFYTSGSNALPGIVSGTYINIPGICSWSPSVGGYIRDVLRTDIDSPAIEIKPDVLSKWGISDIDAFKAMLAANPMGIAYKLAAPVTIRLTPTQILALQGENTLWSDAGEIQVQGATDPEYLTSTGGGAVQSVNGKIGKVELSASDVGALPADTEIPTVPENVSAFENDAGYLTQHQDLSGYAKKSEIPDVSGFITRAVDDLVNYYRKAETYTRNEIDQRISTIPKFSIEVVSYLPSTGISETTIYLVAGGVGGNLYTEYIYVNGAWEILGSQRVDLTGYATQSWTLEQLNGYQLKGNYQPAGDYALKSELPTVPTKISAFENDKGYLTQHQDISGKLDANKLPEAINAALAQAKASGEFDGADGKDGGYYEPSVDAAGNLTWTASKDDMFHIAGANIKGPKGNDGTSVTVEYITQSTVDGGSNVVTFSDGNTVTIKNGSKGSKGDAGEPPVKGVDFWTPADQEQIVQDVIAALGTPVFGRVDENNHITLSGHLADGTYTLRFEDSDGFTSDVCTIKKNVGFTNLADQTSADWLTDTRLSTSGTSSAIGAVTTNFIPCTYGDVIYIKGLDVTKVPDGNARYHIADENKSQIYENGILVDAGYVNGLVDGGLATLDGDVYKIQAGVSATSGLKVGGVAYQRFCGILMDGYTANDVIITVNEPITGGGNEDAPNYINQIPISIDSDGQVYNSGQGWKTGYRLNSTGGETAQDGMEITGFIPAKLGDVVYLQDVDFNIDSSAAATYVWCYDVDFNYIAYNNAYAMSSNVPTSVVTDANGRMIQFTADSDFFKTVKQGSLSNIAYIRLNCAGISNESIITVNQPIV